MDKSIWPGTWAPSIIDKILFSRATLHNFLTGNINPVGLVIWLIKITFVLSLIFSSNNIENVTYFMENADPLIINYFYIIVSDSTNFSTKSNIYSSTIDSRPNPIHIQSVTYDDITMDILWDESLEGDFLKYELYISN